MSALRNQREWLLSLLALGSTVAVVVFVANLNHPPSPPQLPTPDPPGITWANLERIRIGMTLKDVEEILMTRWHARCTPEALGPAPPDCSEVYLWSGTELDILVFVAKNGRVVAAQGNDGKRSEYR
jgi:hypothetical protein